MSNYILLNCALTERMNLCKTPYSWLNSSSLIQFIIVKYGQRAFLCLGYYRESID